MDQTTTFAGLCAAVALMASFSAASAETDPAAIVDSLNAVFGKHDAMRAAHANGICVKGSFTPTAEAATLSKAPQFAGGAAHGVIGRFSMGGGNPGAPNNAKDNARGLALHIDLGKDTTTDLVMISAPVFLTKTPKDFLTLLQTVATKDKDKIGAFFAAHPESTTQGKWLASHPVPASYTGVTYYGVHTFTLVSADGKKQIVKLMAVPTAGELGLTDDEAKAKAPDFYTPELTERLAKGPASFTLTAVLGEPGDAVDDPTALWAEGRKTVALGTVTIAALEPAVTCDAGMFDPTNLADGVEGPKGDGIFAIRSPAYAVSLSRRAK